MNNAWDNKRTRGPLTREEFAETRKWFSENVFDRPSRLLVPYPITCEPPFHHVLGLHADFQGRPYRKGKNRCKYCGSKLVGYGSEYLGNIERLDIPPLDENELRAI